MAKLIALEWDTHEARVAVANPRGNDLVVEQAFAVPLSAPAGEESLTPQEIGQQLRDALAAKGLTKGEALVALPRSSIELRSLSLPQAPPEEIPDMVRFQALQAFTSIGPDWPLDYVELERQDDSITVLAAVASPKQVEQVQQVCSACEFTARCLVLRPFAAVSLLHRYETIDVFRGSLIVDLLPDGADLTAISDGHVVFMRSVRLPASADERMRGRALVGELRRTIGAAQNQMASGQIEQIIICGDQARHATLHQQISEALSLDVIAFDPFEAVRQTRQLKQNLPEHPGRYAPLLGVLASQATGTGHTIDFLNPRKRPKPPSKTGRNVVLAVGVAAIVLFGTFVVLTKKLALDDQIAQLTDKSETLDMAVEKARKLVAKADRIKEFTDGDVTWLDEIRLVAGHLPDADHLILREVSVGVDRQRGGRMILKGNVCSADVIATLEEALRYGDNAVQGTMGVIDRANRDYPYQLNTTIIVPPDKQENGHSLGRPKPEETTTTTGEPAEADDEQPAVESEIEGDTASEPGEPDALKKSFDETPAATEGTPASEPAASAESTPESEQASNEAAENDDGTSAPPESEDSSSGEQTPPEASQPSADDEEGGQVS